jgi:hypothetical protein
LDERAAAILVFDMPSFKRDARARAQMPQPIERRHWRRLWRENSSTHKKWPRKIEAIGRKYYSNRFRTGNIDQRWAVLALVS